MAILSTKKDSWPRKEEFSRCRKAVRLLSNVALLEGVSGEAKGIVQFGNLAEYSVLYPRNKPKKIIDKTVYTMYTY